jgi:hydroxyethylthiazole kinase-like uncharacterized protein yjeF
MTRPRRVTRELLAGMPLPRYDVDASKYARGKLFVVAGSAALPGAAILAGRAALRVGCGTVRLLLPFELTSPVGALFVESMVVARSLEAIRAQYEVCRAGVIGPGLDESEETAELVRTVVAEAPVPLVVDAEALLACAEEPTRFKGPRVFTPHAGEMARLVDVEKRRITLVLKGKETRVTSPRGDVYLDTTGTRALATAGSGDALAGVIGGLIAQEMDPTHAAVWGVQLHGLAGEVAAAELGDDGVLASDVVERLPGVVRELRRATALL